MKKNNMEKIVHIDRLKGLVILVNNKNLK